MHFSYVNLSKVRYFPEHLKFISAPSVGLGTCAPGIPLSIMGSSSSKPTMSFKNTSYHGSKLSNALNNI